MENQNEIRENRPCQGGRENEFSLKLNEVFSLEVGSQLILNATPTSKVKCRIGDVDLYAGTMGRKGEKKAVMIEERLLTDEEG